MLFDWCLHASHSDCPGSYKRFYFEGRKTVYTDEEIKCQCKCHGDKNEG